MYQPIVLFIGWRYLTNLNRTNRFLRLIFQISTVSITFGVMALVSMLSILNGFEQRLKNNILGLIPHVILSSSSRSLDPLKLPKNTIKLKGVTCITPLTTGDVVLQSSHNVTMSVMLGINEKQKDPLTPYLINVKQTDLIKGKYNAILGEQLAKQLDVVKGDQIRVIYPSISQFTLLGQEPSQRLFNIIGTFATNNEMDNYQMLVNIHDASHLMHYPKGIITGWRLWLREPMKVNELSQYYLGTNIKLFDWRERKGELFQAVRMEKNMMILLLSIIVVIAIFNIIAPLSFTVMEKQNEIAILKSQGLTSRQIIAIFIVNGASLAIIGIIFGTIFGIFLTNYLNKFIHLISSMLDFEELPVLIEPIQIISVAFLTMAITLVSTLYPSFRAAKTSPAEILRYE